MIHLAFELTDNTQWRWRPQVSSYGACCDVPIWPGDIACNIIGFFTQFSTIYHTTIPTQFPQLKPIQTFESGINVLLMFTSVDTGIYSYYHHKTTICIRPCVVLWCCVQMNSRFRGSKPEVTNNLLSFCLPIFTMTYKHMWARETWISLKDQGIHTIWQQREELFSLVLPIIIPIHHLLHQWDHMRWII